MELNQEWVSKAPASDAETALAYFDATFPREKPHG